jgi:voltage-gated potassium channel
MRKRLYEIIEVADTGDSASNIYDICMMLCIIVSLAPLCTHSNAQWTSIVDMVTVTIFIVDYLLREITADYQYPELKWKAFVRYPFSFMAIVDLLSIVPSFGLFTQGLKVFRVFRLFRTLKVLKALKAAKAFKALKIFRYSRSLKLIISVIKQQKEALITVGCLAVGYILIAALIIFNVEPDSFPNFFDAVYWACVSLTTVGYGDIYPVSTAGRVVTMLSSVVGIAIVALPSSIITAGYMDAVQHRNDELQD